MLLHLLPMLLFFIPNTCFNHHLVPRQSLQRWSRSPPNCGINFWPLKRRYFPCFKKLPSKEQRKREDYDHIMETQSTATAPTHRRANNRVSPRIAGGDDSLPGEFPWSVGIDEFIDRPYPQSDYWNQICNGAFVLPDWVLTAAHCMYSNEVRIHPSRIRIRYNSESRRYQDLDQVNVYKIIVHPQYNVTLEIQALDICLIRLTRSISFEQINQKNYFRANAICLPETPWSLVDNEDVFWMTSFGPFDYSGNKPDVLQKFMVVPREIWYPPNRTILFSDFEIGYSACGGDSGSPVAFHNRDGRFFSAGVHVSNHRWNDTVCGYSSGRHAQVINFDNLEWVKETISNDMGW